MIKDKTFASTETKRSLERSLGERLNRVALVPVLHSWLSSVVVVRVVLHCAKLNVRAARCEEDNIE